MTSMGKVDWYLQFIDDNKMSYEYILSITEIWMGQFNTYNSIYSAENKEGNREN